MAKEKRAVGRYRSLAVCGGAALVGALGGCLLAAFAGAAAPKAVTGFFLGYQSALSAGRGVASLGALAWNNARWPLLVFLLGFTALGVAMTPFLFALRGACLSFCVALLARTMAGQGTLIALVLFGIESLFALPVLFVLGAQSWEAARLLGGHVIYTPKLKSPYVSGYWLRSLACAMILAVGTLIEYAALPPLLRALFG